MTTPQPLRIERLEDRIQPAGLNEFDLTFPIAIEPPPPIITPSEPIYSPVDDNALPPIYDNALPAIPALPPMDMAQFAIEFDSSVWIEPPHSWDNHDDEDVVAFLGLMDASDPDNGGPDTGEIDVSGSASLGEATAQAGADVGSDIGWITHGRIARNNERHPNRGRPLLPIPIVWLENIARYLQTPDVEPVEAPVETQYRTRRPAPILADETPKKVLLPGSQSIIQLILKPEQIQEFIDNQKRAQEKAQNALLNPPIIQADWLLADRMNELLPGYYSGLPRDDFQSRLRMFDPLTRFKLPGRERLTGPILKNPLDEFNNNLELNPDPNRIHRHWTGFPDDLGLQFVEKPNTVPQLPIDRSPTVALWLKLETGEAVYVESVRLSEVERYLGKVSDLRAATNEPDWLFHLKSVPLGLYEGAEDVVDMVNALLHPIRLANDIDDMLRKITRDIVFNDGQNIIRSRDMLAESLMNEPLRLPSRLAGNWLMSVAALESAGIAMSKVPALYNALATSTMTAAERVLLKSFTDQLRRLKELPDAKQVVGFLKGESGMVLLDEEARQISQIIATQTGTSMTSKQFDELMKHLADPGDVLRVMSANDELLQLLKTYGVDATQLNANELKIIQDIALKYEVRTPSITTTTVGDSSGINLAKLADGEFANAGRPAGYTRMQDYVRHLDNPATSAATQLSLEQAFALHENLQAIASKTVPAVRVNIQAGKSIADATQGLQGQFNLPRFRFIDQVSGGRAAINAILQEFPNLRFPH